MVSRSSYDLSHPMCFHPSSSISSHPLPLSPPQPSLLPASVPCVWDPASELMQMPRRGLWQPAGSGSYKPRSWTGELQGPPLLCTEIKHPIRHGVAGRSCGTGQDRTVQYKVEYDRTRQGKPWRNRDGQEGSCLAIGRACLGEAG